VQVGKLAVTVMVNKKCDFMKKFFCVAAILASLSFLISSCEVGMGVAVDLEAPVLTITSHSIYASNRVPRTFTLSGTAVDNIATTSVKISYSYVDSQNRTVAGERQASLSGENWSCTFTFDEDPEVNMIVTATDKNNNTSEDSTRTITMVVDSQDPECKELHINRCGGSFQADFIPLADLKYKVERELEKDLNIDYFQNQEIVISGTLLDNYQIVESSMNFRKTDGSLLLDTWISDTATVSKYNPEFVFDDSIPKVAALPENEPTYLRPVIRISDGENVREEAYNGWFCWYPDYDKPHVSFPLSNLTDEKGKFVMELAENTDIALDVFDDDEINTVSWKLLPYTGNVDTYRNLVAAEKTSIKNEAKNLIENAAGFTSVGGNGNRIKSFVIDHSSIPAAGKYFLLVVAEDKNGTKSYEAIQTDITNSDIPIIIVESPEENTAPSVTNGKFTFSGYTLDNDRVSYMALAWCESNESASKATACFKNGSYDFDNADNNPLTVDGNVYYKLTPSAKPDANSKKKDSFSKTFDVTGSEGIYSDSNSDKIFVIGVRDSTGNIVTRTFKTGTFTDKPTMTISWSATQNGTYTQFEESVKVFQPAAELYIKVVPSGGNGLPVKSVVPAVNSGEDSSFSMVSSANGVYLYKYTGLEPLDRTQIQFTVTDVLDNSKTSRITFTVEEKPVLQRISTINADGTTKKKDQKITFEAKFSKNVDVTGTPKIKIGGIYKEVAGVETAVTNAFATYKSGSGRDTLLFEYTVREGEYTKENAPVSIPTAAYPFTEDASNKISDYDKTVKVSALTRSIYIDAVIPVYTGYKSKETDTSDVTVKTAIISSDKVTIELKFSEDVKTEKGKYTVSRTEGWYIPPVISNDVFLEILNKATDAQKNTLVGWENNQLALKDNSYVPKGPYQQTTHGLKLSGGKYIPDSDTKYMLAFEYDISSQSGTVQALRTVLEALNYHKIESDISTVKSPTRSAVQGYSDTQILTISSSDFIDGLKNGVEYKIDIPAGAFKDKVGNLSQAFSLNFWTDKTATPVIRVERTTYDARNDYSSGKTYSPEMTEVSPEPSEFYRKFTVYNQEPANKQVRVKIDCETPGAAITYVVDESRTAVYDSDEAKRPAKTASQQNNIEDITAAAMNSLSPSVAYSLFYVGKADDFTTAQKIYIKAKATKAASTGVPALTDSLPGYEGAFRTTIIYERPNSTVKTATTDSNSTKTLLFHATPYIEGNPGVAGFPLTQNGENIRNFRIMYYVASNTNPMYYMLSWEFVTAYAIQTNAASYQNPADAYGVYGQCLYTYEHQYWGGGIY